MRWRVRPRTPSAWACSSARHKDRAEKRFGSAGRATSRLLSTGDAMALVRDGRTARHIGPLFADTPAHALAMVRQIAASERGPILIDAVASQSDFIDGLAADSWTVERPFQRMRFGRASRESEELPFAVAGPEFG